MTFLDDAITEHLKEVAIRRHLTQDLVRWFRYELAEYADCRDGHVVTEETALTCDACAHAREGRALFSRLLKEWGDGSPEKEPPDGGV